MRAAKLLAFSLTCTLLSACAFKAENAAENFLDTQPTGSMQLEYADQFSVDFYENGVTLIKVEYGENYLLVPEGVNVPNGVPEDVKVIKQPLENIYSAASSAMDLLDGIGALDSVKFTSTPSKEWVLPNIKTAVENEDILYAGKYSAPDYELIISEQCGAAVESTMIYHSPEIKEQLERLGVPVIVERSSYEAHPLGRLEWVKFYGVLLGKEAEAERFFTEKTKPLEDVFTREKTGKTAAFFYINSSGIVNVRKPGDYVSKMIELAGGEYVLTPENTGIEDNSLSTVNMQFEAFYAAAKDADFLIYNSTVDGALDSVDDMLSKNKLLADFKAVREGNVWCTEKNIYQQTTGAAEMISDMSKIFNGDAEEKLQFFYKIN